MAENDTTPTPTEIAQAARDVLEWVEQYGHMLGLDVDVAHRGKYAELHTSDLRMLIAAAYRVPPVPHAETSACPVLVPNTASKSLRVRRCGAVMWIDPDGDMNTYWKCAAGHDQDSPDAV